MTTATRLCSTCKAVPVDARFRPFCSARCKDVDLSRWLTGGYAIPGGVADADDDSDDPSLETSEHLATPADRRKPEVGE